MCGEQGFIAVRETVHLVKFIGKGCSIFFSSAYVSGTTGCKILQYSSRIHMVYLPHNNGSFENEALENEDRSTKHPNLENEAP